MDSLETQVAKIEIGNNKQTNAYVFVMAEKDSNDVAELFLIVELPLFNPAALPDCERISEAIAASLKRAYRGAINDNTFENALTQINEELSKLAEIGKTHWIGKLNALIGVKNNNTLHVAATGKISALLLRDGQFVTVADSAPTMHPLKTFENFAVGTLRLNDTLILSSTQLFNFLSIDRLRNILSSQELPDGAQEIIDILQENAGPEVAFATLITMEVEPGSVPDETVDLEEFVESSREQKAPMSAAVGSWAGAVRNHGVGAARRGIQSLVNLFRNRKQVEVKQFIQRNRHHLTNLTSQARENLNPQKFAQFSRAKKFFFISALVLFLALVTNIFVAAHFKKQKQAAADYSSKIVQMQQIYNDANAAYLYHDEASAATKLNDLQSQIKDMKNITATQQLEVAALQKQINDLRGKIEHKVTVTATNVATLSGADNLIKLPDYFATQTNGTIISYNRSSGKIQDNVLKSSEKIIESAYIKPNLAVVYNGTSLLDWNYQTGSLGLPFVQSVPTQEHELGLAYYPVNKRVYLINKTSGDVVSFAVGDKTFTKPVISVAGANEAKQAVSFTVDGAVYFYSGNRIAKYVSGKPAEFNLTSLAVPLSGSGKIYSQNDFKNLYVLDAGNNRILVLDKKGSLQKAIESPQFSKLKDFAIDEKSGTMYVLNDTSLLKLNF